MDFHLDKGVSTSIPVGGAIEPEICQPLSGAPPSTLERIKQWNWPWTVHGVRLRSQSPDLQSCVILSHEFIGPEFTSPNMFLYSKLPWRHTPKSPSEILAKTRHQLSENNIWKEAPGLWIPPSHPPLPARRPQRNGMPFPQGCIRVCFGKSLKRTRSEGWDGIDGIRTHSQHLL